MRALLAFGLVVGLGAFATADDKKKADPVGTWKLGYEIGDQKREATLTLKKDGDKYAGTMAWPDKQEAKLADVKVKDGEVTFTADREVMGNKFNIKYKLTADGDKLKGKGSVDVGGETRDFDIEGTRAKAEKKEEKKDK